MNNSWQDDNKDLSKRVEELELQMAEMLNRMQQYENVMTTAFRMRDAGDWRISKK